MTAQLPPISPVQSPSLADYDSPVASPSGGAPAAPSTQSAAEHVRNVSTRRVGGERDRSIIEQEARDVAALREAAAKMNDVAEAISANIRYRVHERSDMLQVQIVDIANNDKVIREVPATEMLNALARTHEALGLVFDANA